MNPFCGMDPTIEKYVKANGSTLLNIAFQPQPAEPAIGQVQMHLVAQPALGTDPIQ
jgi:hypothetical protein